MPGVSYGSLLRSNRDFRLYWAGQIVSQLGDWFSIITIQALLLKYTGSAGSLAGLMIATMLPGFLLGPLAGIAVDRLPRKAVMIGADLFRAAVALGLLYVRGPESVWVAYVCVAGLYAFSAFFEPARIATLPNITSREELVTANALSSVTWSVLLTSGAMLGGIVGHVFGPRVAFVLNSLSFVASALILARLRVPPTDHGHAPAGGIVDLAAGFRYVREHPEIRRALTAKMGWGLAGGMQVLVPVFGARMFPLPGDRDGQLSISLLFAAGGLGTAMGPVIARRLAGHDIPRIRWAIAVSFIAGGLFHAAIAGAPDLGRTALFLLLARMHGSVVWVFSTVMLQMLVEDRFRGRVFAAETSLFTATMMLSSVAVATLLDSGTAGVPQLTLLMAAVSLASGLLWMTGLRRTAEGQPARRSEPEIG